jgi:hypothetical protein
MTRAPSGMGAPARTAAIVPSRTTTVAFLTTRPSPTTTVPPLRTSAPAGGSAPLGATAVVSTAAIAASGRPAPFHVITPPWIQSLTSAVWPGTPIS